ncbi:hypothetical protein LHYA1_G008675 [Lachnellula hyalina]|uniref:SANT domain-containing protein n=1 Tax=Lachnellula hyalina TaxID=1316788 RepID=A0A8H8QU78_9HELO|nr:uncharacterized protein LHYA1_G008675 [Lachnellula hyalina]TVY22868.1 hypothetical protein LHYA1_G008675 [Lachnellula hyalina]
METEDLDPLGRPFPFPDEDSGSAYENPESEQSLSDEEGKASPRATSSGKGRRTKTSNIATSDRSGNNRDIASDTEESQDGAFIEEQNRQNAESWAATFQGPESPSEIKRLNRPSISRPRKRKSHKPASGLRAKRLKAYHNNKYRELMNTNIHDVTTKLARGWDEFPKTQIGISIWTSQEKDKFYSALQRLGRDDIRGIAEQIGTKSEQEVHEYILLLHEGLVDKISHEDRSLPLTDIPAAVEISEECCAILEKAGDFLVSRQELHEEKVEKAKWGDTWLVTETIARRLEKYRRDGEGEAAIDQVLPATNLFNLRNWLELSSQVFMNSNVDDNWQDLAEEGEQPAIRATAFEDFHSLAFNHTKRLLQTTLFCAMSREKATRSKKVKHAEVKPDDVEAAVAILKMKGDSNEFWVKASRRNRLRVVNDDSSGDGDVAMSYDEVESELQPTERFRSRSRSTSRPADDRSDPSSDSSVDDASEDENDIDNLTSDPETDSSNRPERAQNRAHAHLAALYAEETAAEAYDMRASKAEEIELWKILEQEPPDEIIKDELVDQDEASKGIRETRDGEDWRERIEAMSEWEVFKEPIPEEAFRKNRWRKSRRAMRKEERGVAEVYSDDIEESEGDGSDRLVAESDEGGVAEVDNDDSEGDGDRSERLVGGSEGEHEATDSNSEPSDVEKLDDEGPVAGHRSVSGESENLE